VSRTAKRWLWLVVVLVVAGVAAGLALFLTRSSKESVTVSPSPSAETCPLTGRPSSGGVPQRPALGVKVDNSPPARPPTGLDRADLVYEEPVEGGITRFLAIFQCSDARVIEPVRSGRLVDPDLLAQFGRPLLGYAGAIDPVVAKIAASPVHDVSAAHYPSAYHRDSKRVGPYNLVTSTSSLWNLSDKVGAAKKAPSPVFDYGSLPPNSEAVARIHVPFSSFSDVAWTWDQAGGQWLRSYLGSTRGPAALSGGGQIGATNVIVEKVVLTVSPYQEDPTGVHEFEVGVTGSGAATVYRDGRAIAGRWERAGLGDRTAFVDPAGKPIALAPGPTWIELVPTTVVVQNTPA
jgi:hypothetical protein